MNKEQLLNHKDFNIQEVNGMLELLGLRSTQVIAMTDDTVILGQREITELDIPHGVEVIGEDAFYECGLTSVTIPDSVTTIRDSAFEFNKLKSVWIPDSVNYIGASAFYGNPLPREFELPRSISYIGERAFGFPTTLLIRAKI